MLLLYLFRLSLLFRTTLCFFYLDIRSRVECRTVLSFDRVTSSDLLLLNDFDIPTLLHRSSGSRSYPDISFALFSIALSCSWDVLQNLGSDHLPILLTVPLFPAFHPNERLPSLNFWKAPWNDFAFYFDSHCPSAEEYSSLFLSFAAVLRTSLTLNALLMVWCSGQTALFLSLLAKTALAHLPAALPVALRPPFSFQQAQYAQVFPLKPAPFWTLFAGLGSTTKSAIYLLFSYHLSLALFSPPCSLLHLSFYLNLCQKLFSLFSSSIRLQWVPGHSFLPDNDAANELARRGALLIPSAIPCSHSSIISGIPFSFFSDWRRTVSSKFFDTQVTSISTEELVLLRRARYVLSRLCCNGHSLLLSFYFSRIGKIENPSCSACGHPALNTSHLILHCPATNSLRRSLFGSFLSLYDLCPRPWGVFRLLGLHGLPPSTHSSEGVG